MAKWIEPIFDRTRSDVDYALAKIEEWRKNGSTNVYELKGCFNVTDINRIAGNIQYLAETLKPLYYFPNCKTNRINWGGGDFPHEGSINLIIGDVRELCSVFFQTSTAPALPDTILTYEQVNSLEENLYLIKQILDDMVEYANTYRQCGTFVCGGGV